MYHSTYVIEYCIALFFGCVCLDTSGWRQPDTHLATWMRSDRPDDLVSGLKNSQTRTYQVVTFFVLITGPNKKRVPKIGQ